MNKIISTNSPEVKNIIKARINKAYTAIPVTETLTNGFFSVDNKWTVKYWNKAAEIILGVAAADIIGKNLWQKFADIIPVELYAIDQRSFLKKAPVHFREYWGELGAWFDVITYHCDGILSVSFKSSRHPHIEYPGDPVQRLKVLTELYQSVTEITNDCLWEWNLQEKDIFWIDGGHKRVFGYPVENALIPQIFWENCIHPDDKERVLKGVQDIITAGSSPLWEDKYRFRAANGSYHYVHDRAHIVYDEAGMAIRMIGATGDITENVLLEKKQVQARLNRQREITDAVLIAQEKERTAIATELNENLSQLLVAAKWNIEKAKNDENLKDICLKNSSDYLAQVIGEIKRMYKALVIPDIRVIGLFENIHNLIRDMNREQQVKFSFYETGIDLEEDLDKNIQLDIFRMVQEQLNNIITHADATHATIKLIREDNKIILTISDNGKGNNNSAENKGVGIINMISRAELYNGFVSINSKSGEGYTLKVVLPCFQAVC